jgi:DNA-binding MarR family transcriptional regulator
MMDTDEKLDRRNRTPAAPRRGRAAARTTISDQAEFVAGDNKLDLSELTDAVGYALRRAQIAVFEEFIDRVAALDLKPAQYSVLLTLGRNPGRKQSEIAVALGIQQPNFVALLDELEKRGLAERVRSPTDRRSHAVVLTKDGRALLERARVVQADHETALAERLAPGGREVLLALLRRLVGSASVKIHDTETPTGKSPDKRQRIRRR